MSHPATAPLLAWARRLRHPTLFKLTAVLFVIDLLCPFDDLLPPYFLDELMLGLTTLLLANWKRKPEPARQSASRASP